VNPWFAIFGSLGIGSAFGLLPPRLIVVGVCAQTVLTVLVRGTPPQPWIMLVNVTLPLLYVGVWIGNEVEKRKRANAKLEAALRENTGLHAQLLVQAREAGVLDERQRLAREIHDTLAQGLAGIITQLQAAERTGGRTHLDAAARLARESLSEARRSVRALRPEPLEDTRLADAVRELADTWSRDSGVATAVSTEGTPRLVTADQEVALFRVAQEALANVAKHANASRVGLTLSYLDDQVVLDVRDDGSGLAADQEGGFGLTVMRQRMTGVGGRLAIESEPGAGTAISASVPHG
jgi:signal transduction histidine kinase